MKLRSVVRRGSALLEPQREAISFIDGMMLRIAAQTTGHQHDQRVAAPPTLSEAAKELSGSTIEGDTVVVVAKPSES